MNEDVERQKELAIIELFWQRDDKAVQELDKMYGRFCYSISWQLLKNREDTQECLNDTWLQTWYTIPDIRPISLKSYVAKIIRNISLNRIESRDAKKRGNGELAVVYDELQEMIGGRDLIAEMIDRQVFSRVLNRFLARMGETERNVFVLRFWYCYSPGEIAKRYHLKKKTVYNMLYQMRREFEAEWKEENRI